MYKRFTQNFGKLDAELVGEYDMPLLRREDMGLPSRWIGFNEVNSYKRDCTSTGVHFFLDDYQFERVWQRPSVYVRSLRRFAVVATPDFSMYTERMCDG